MATRLPRQLPGDGIETPLGKAGRLAYGNAMRLLGRLLQIVGLWLPPLGIVLQIVPGPGGKPMLTLGQMLVVLVAGVCLFFIGRLVEGYSGGRD